MVVLPAGIIKYPSSKLITLKLPLYKFNKFAGFYQFTHQVPVKYGISGHILPHPVLLILSPTPVL